MVTAYFLGSSALVKRYVLETGTPWVRRVTRHNPSTVIYIAHITAVEVTCAVARRRRGKTLSRAFASSILRRFRQHLAARHVVIEATPALLDDAVRLGDAHALRAYDAVQLAVTLEVNRSHQAGESGPVTLVCADRPLNEAARDEGLPVDEENRHP